MRSLASLLAAAILLTGCAGVQPKPPTPPNVDLLLDCPTPAVQVKTNGEMADTLSKYRAALQGCNDDKATLRTFYAIPDTSPRP